MITLDNKIIHLGDGIVIKNNIIALLTHCLCIIFSLIVSMLSMGLLFIGAILSIFIWFVYVFIGTKLKLYNSILKNILSVSLVGVIGLIMVIINLIVPGVINELTGIYIFPNITIFIASPEFIQQCVHDNYLFILIIIFTPTILMWLGLQWKEKRIKRREST